MSRIHRSQSRDQAPDYSGPPFYDTMSQSLNSSGFDGFAALGHPSLFESSGFSAAGHTAHQPPPQSPFDEPFHPEYSGSYFPHPGGPGTGQASAYGLSQEHDAYWHGNAQSHDDSTPLPSPALLSANSMNLPPLYTGSRSGQCSMRFSEEPPYDYPAPPDVPYAESAASIASSNLSQPEDEDNPRSPMPEEKRRRNLAASARFRQKKKIRENQLEKATKDLSDRATGLEEKISSLEQENKFLKALLTEKETDMTEKEKKRFREFAAAMEQGDM